MGQERLFAIPEGGGDPEDDIPHAFARNTDPPTSHEAARSIPPEKIRKTQRLVLGLLKKHGPMTDTRMMEVAMHEGLAVSPSGMRTRRAELVKLKLVEPTGVLTKLSSERSSIIWAATE